MKKQELKEILKSHTNDLGDLPRELAKQLAEQYSTNLHTIQACGITIR